MDNTSTGPARSREEVALELMKFIAVQTAYGKGSGGPGFGPGKPQRTAEEFAEALLELYGRCRQAVSE